MHLLPRLTRSLWSFAALAAALVFAPGCSADNGDDDGDADEPVGEPSEAITGATCSPTRAAGAVNRFQKALNDSIAFAEGTEGRAKDGYNVGFAYKNFSSCARHPNINTQHLVAY